MRKLLFILVFAAVIPCAIFSEVQVECNFGWFFDYGKYSNENEMKRDINGAATGVLLRYFPLSTFGLLLGINNNILANANNNDYTNWYINNNMTPIIDGDIGARFSVDFGIALSFPINNRLAIQSDIGVSYIFYSIEAITGSIEYMGYKSGFTMSLEYTEFDLFGKIYGRLRIGSLKNTYFTFGIRVAGSLYRHEKTEITISRSLLKYDDVPDYFGITVLPVIGIMWKF